MSGADFLDTHVLDKSLKTTLKAEIDEDALVTLNSDSSHPFVKPRSGRIAVMVINHARRRLGSLNTIGAFLNRVRHLRREEIL